LNFQVTSAFHYKADFDY